MSRMTANVSQVLRGGMFGCPISRDVSGAPPAGGARPADPELRLTCTDGFGHFMANLPSLVRFRFWGESQPGVRGDDAFAFHVRGVAKRTTYPKCVASP